MKKATYVWLACMLSLASLQAQMGSIGGTVLDLGTAAPLPGATVQLMGQPKGAVTDLEGDFLISGVTPGPQRLLVRYLGYATDTIAVTVTAGQVATVQIGLVPVVTSLGEVQIVGTLEGQQKALNQQRSADNIKNIVSADLIGRFPDLNVAEALQRVPGVNISRSRGEGSTVSLRGTPRHFTAININGEQIPSTQESGARNESLDLIPADQLASMEVTKALTPDMDGDAIGGSVNLRTPTARSLKLRTRLEGGGGYNSLSQQFNGIGRVRLDQRFFQDPKTGQGRLGVLAGFSYFRTNNEEDKIETVWSPFGNTPIQALGQDTVVIENTQWRDLVNTRTRIGATLTLDYRFSPTSEIIFNFMYNRRADADEQNRLRIFLNESAAIQWRSLDTMYQTQLRRDIQLNDAFSDNFTYNLQGRHQWGLLQVDWGAFYADSRRRNDGLSGRFERGEANRIDLVATNPGGIYADFVRYQALEAEQDFYDPFVITDIARYDRQTTQLDATNLVAKVNLALPVELGPVFARFQVGGKYRRQTNTLQRLDEIFQFSDPNRVLDQRAGFASVVSDFEDEDFLGDEIRFGPGIDPVRFRDFIRTNRNLFVYDPIRSDRNSFNGSYGTAEDILAGYAMGRLEWQRFMLLAGLRYERNAVDYEAYAVNNVTGEAQPVADGTAYDFFLPNVHLRYRLNPLTNLRGALTYSYARANFNDLVPFLNIDEEGSRIQAGNAALRPGAAFNLDLMAERYLGNVGILSVGAFYKRIDDFQFTRNLRFLRPGDPYYEDFPGFAFRQEQNGERALVYGIEANAMANLTFLPGPLKGTALYLNYTWAESDAFTSDRTDINLPGQAAHTWNAALSWDYKRFSLKGSVNYNGSFLSTVAGEARNDVVQASRMQVDLSGSIELIPDLRLYGEFMNVTNAPAILYQGIRARIAEYALFGWWNRFGLSYTF